MALSLGFIKRVKMDGLSSPSHGLICRWHRTRPGLASAILCGAELDIKASVHMVIAGPSFLPLGAAKWLKGKWSTGLIRDNGVYSPQTNTGVSTVTAAKFVSGIQLEVCITHLSLPDTGCN